MLSQIRLLESRRLNDKMGKISQKQFDEVRDILKSMIWFTHLLLSKEVLVPNGNLCDYFMSIILICQALKK